MSRKRIVLDGGPKYSFGPGDAQPDNEKVKILLGAGYEHFVHSGTYVEIDGENLPVFQWSGRTKIAE